MCSSNITVCVAGKNAIAVNVARFLLGRKDINLVSLPNPEDDGKDGWQPSFLKYSKDNNIKIISEKYLEDNNILTLISLEYSRILSTNNIASSKLYNVHFSLLPKYRGCHTSVWPLLNGEIEHGVTLHEIDSGIDSGNIIAQKRFPIRPEYNARDLYLICMRLGCEVVIDSIELLLSGVYESIPQDEKIASYYDRNSINYKELNVDFDRNVGDIVNYVRAFTFQEYQLVKYRGKEVVSCAKWPFEGAWRPGELLSFSEKAALVGAKDGVVRLQFVSTAEAIRCL